MHIWVTYGNFCPVNTLPVISLSPGDREDLPRILSSSQVSLPRSLQSGFPNQSTARNGSLQIESSTAATQLCVIAAVVFVLICLLVVMVRYMYRHKGTYHTNEAKGTEFAESADAALKNDPALQEAVDESKKEYFI
uniref:Neurexin/syndecan/glycophorin C domain-containing protein n=1 Tax=Falco tinnunculus TaxID=100819 RepID=A0A8C4USF9_FALTI